jgi:hypothetical protein
MVEEAGAVTPSTRAETNWVRMPGVFATNPTLADEQLQLPIAAPGINVVLVAATSYLRLSPDFDIVVWLGERWLQGGESIDPEGWVHFTFYELVKGLYSGDGSKNRQVIRASLRRLATTLFTVDGYDAVTKRPNARVVSEEAVITALRGADPKTLIRSEDLMTVRAGRAELSSDARRLFGALRGNSVSVRLGSWMCAQLAAGSYTYVDFAMLRRLDGVAKRVWVYLQAETFTKRDEERSETVIGLGRPALNCLGVGNYAQLRQARAALNRAGAAICRQDHRYESIAVHRFSRSSYQLRVVKLTPQAARARLCARQEHEEAERLDRELAQRAASQARAREALQNSSYADLAEGEQPVILRAWPTDLAEARENWEEHERVLLTVLEQGGAGAEHARRRLHTLYAVRDSAPDA